MLTVNYALADFVSLENCFIGELSFLAIYAKSIMSYPVGEGSTNVTALIRIAPFAYLRDVLAWLPKADYQQLDDLFSVRWANP